MATIKINDKEYPINFSLNTVRNFCIKKEIKYLNKFSELFSQENLSDISIEMLDNIVLLILTGIEDGCRRENKEADLNIESIYDAFESDPEIFAKALSLFADSRNTTLESKNVKAPRKKNQRG